MVFHVLLLRCSVVTPWALQHLHFLGCLGLVIFYYFNLLIVILLGFLLGFLLMFLLGLISRLYNLPHPL